MLCGERTISLVRADVRGGRVILSGIVAASVAGQKVAAVGALSRRRGKAEKLGRVTPGADGKFQARVTKPPHRLFKLARYRAQIGTASSVELKLPAVARLHIAQAGVGGHARAARSGGPEARRQAERGRGQADPVRQVHDGRAGEAGPERPYAVRFPAPASGGSALYRAESRVLARPGSKRYVKQFARAIGITF